MIELREGDLLKADAEALVNTVNCVGVMGRGIALQFKKAFPGNFKSYKKVCDRKELKPGSVLAVDLQRIGNPRYILNFPTKTHWRAKSRLEHIESGLVDLVRKVEELGLQSVAIPPLGCGLGGLDWGDVFPLIESAFTALPDVEVLVFPPGGAPAPKDMVRAADPPRMTPGRAALLGLMRRYLAAVMDPEVTLLELHKLMYFMQEAGEPLRLSFKRGHYGPYAENLRHVLSHIDGHFIEGYGDAKDQPDKPLELKAEAATAAESYLAEASGTRDHFEAVVRLIEGFESAYGLELLATLHWLGAHEGVAGEDLVKATYDWNARKRMFPERHILKAWDVLVERGWLGECHQLAR